MKKGIALLFIAALGQQAHAALAPEVQRSLDLTVMYEYVKGHKIVLKSLRLIDLQDNTVHFGSDCKVLFDRPASPYRIGPLEKLKFKDATCPVGEETQINHLDMNLRRLCSHLSRERCRSIR